MPATIEPVPLHEATRHRYLSYALSVITSRALPDVRDGLKPVQRRILYAMYNNLGLRPDARYRKSAAVVGEVMAKFHPHGDQAIYDAMVRMAQPFSLRHPLVDGQGNFGSVDGDPPAAARYTEAKLRPIALALLTEIKQQTVHFRPNYDGQHFEPVVLPAQVPQILVNGSEGIAVGMATKIPPHNLREIIDACTLLIDAPATPLEKLCKKIKGPDFPTGGEILTPPEDLLKIYETGQGPVTVRGTFEYEKKGRRHHAVLTSLPYGLNKATLVEKIGQLIIDKKIPQLLDVRDESTDDVRVVLELRKERDLMPAMAYLYKHTPLQQRYHVNLTCLIPTENPEVGAPDRLDLRTLLRIWLDFRQATVRKRFEYELRKLLERIHILEGFEKIFDDLDLAIQIIRASEGKRDAAEKLMDRFDLDDVQVDAVLETKLYKLARLEILAIRKELAELRAEAERIEEILSSEERLWAVVRQELREVRKAYGQPRRTALPGETTEALEYSEADYIVAEDTFVIVTREGWLKRQAGFSAIDKIRIREDDSIGWLFQTSTRHMVTICTDQGNAYTIRADDVPATSGYGEPIQRHFNFAAGERIVGVLSHDPRRHPERVECDQLYGVCVSRGGRGLRFPLSAHDSPSTKNGRRYQRLEDGDTVVATYLTGGAERASLATRGGNMLSYPAAELNAVARSGKGVLAIKLNDGDEVLAFELAVGQYEGATVVTSRGREETARASKFSGSRGGKGRAVLRRGGFKEWLQAPEILLPKTDSEGNEVDAETTEGDE